MGAKNNMEEKKIAVVNEEERKEIFKLHRYIDGLEEFLYMLSNTNLSINNIEYLENKAKKHLYRNKDLLNIWWETIRKKYHLLDSIDYIIIYQTGEIVNKPQDTRGIWQGA